MLPNLEVSGSFSTSRLVAIAAATLVGLSTGCLSGSANNGADGTASGLTVSTPAPLEVDTTTSNADARDTNGSAAAANQVVEPPAVVSDFPSLDANAVQGEANSLVGYAAAEGPVSNTPKQSIVVRARPFECLDAHGLDTNALFVQVWGCNDTDAQAFSFLPDGHVQLAVKLPGSESPNYCLAAIGGGNVGFAVCADELNQRWAAGGHLLQAQSSGNCLSRQSGSLSRTRLGLAPCRRDDARQSWAVGKPSEVIRASSEANPPFPTGPDLPTSGAQSLVGFARLAAPPAVSQPLEVLLRHGLQVSFADDGRPLFPRPELHRHQMKRRLVFQPDGHLETENVVKRSMQSCVGARASTTGEHLLYVDDCTNDPNLAWTVSGHNIRHTATGFCLAYDEKLWADRTAALRPCDATEVRQSWAFGEQRALRAQAQAAQRGYSKEQLCKASVTAVEPEKPNQDIKWVLNRFGGTMNGFKQFQETELGRMCAAIYASSTDVYPALPALLQFEEVGNPNALATADFHPHSVITYSESSPWSQWGDDWLRGTIAHEAVHINDFASIRSGTNYGWKFIVEGFADWVVLRTGSTYKSKKKGGDWSEGYAASAFFLYWLDAKYPPTAPGLRFTERLKTASISLGPDDETWLKTYIKKETGFSLDELWAQYQKSF